MWIYTSIPPYAFVLVKHRDKFVSGYARAQTHCTACVILVRSVVGLDFTGKQDDETELPYEAFACKSVRARARLQQL
jgi:hypothetical protein